MNVNVVIPTPLRQYAGGQKTVAVAGATVNQALDALTATHPDLRRHLFSEDGRLRSFVNVYLGDEDIRYLRQGDTPLTDGATLSIVPSVAGGDQRMGNGQAD
ncbi:MAG TPA: ubiquitin-like small modifier protein 1 [Anaerolineae bacterium]